MRFLVTSILAVSGVGAYVAVDRHREARFAGVRLPGRPVGKALTVGTPLSAPPIMLGALVFGAARGRTDIVRVIAALFLVGILGEPDTWSALRRPNSHRLTTACVVLEMALPVALLQTSTHRVSAPQDRATAARRGTRNQ